MVHSSAAASAPPISLSTTPPSQLSYLSHVSLKQALRSSALLASINNDITDADLEELINQGNRVEFPAQQYLIHQGIKSSSPDDLLYIIEDGDVQVEVQEGKTQVRVGRVKVSDLVGDQALYTDHPPSASIVTQSIVHAYAIPKHAFDAFIAQHPTVQENLNHRKWLWSSMSKVPQFQDLDDDLKKESLIASFRQSHVNGGQTIISFGDVGDQFYVIEEGHCDVLVPFTDKANAAATTTADQLTATVNSVLPGSTSPSPTSHNMTTTTVDLITPPPSPITASATPFTALTDDSIINDIPPPIADVRVATKGPGEYFGEIALLYAVPRSATIKCASDSGCVLWSVDGNTFRSTCAEASLFLKKIFFEYASVRDTNTGQLLMTEKNFFAALRKTGLQQKAKKQQTGEQKMQEAAKQYKQQQQQRQGDTTEEQSSSHTADDQNNTLSEAQLRLMFRLADQSGDNLISFSEFVLLNSLLRTPLSKYQFAFRMFDKDKSGTIDREEFIQVVKSLTEDKANTHDWQHDPFISDLFGDDSSSNISGQKKVLTYGQFESLLNRDVLPTYLSEVKHDLRIVDEYWLRWNQVMIADSSVGMIATDGKTSFAFPSWKSLVAGGVAGAVSRTVVSPLERIKLLFQMQGEPPKNVIRITPTSAFQFFFYDLYKKIFFSGRTELNPIERLAAGGLAGCTACVLTYPLDLIRARLTLQSGANRQYKGIIHGLTKVVRDEGFFALYKGLWPSVAGIFPYIGIDFMCYETLRNLLPYNPYFRTSHGDPRKVSLLACGAIAGVVGQTIAYPLDLVRRRLQVQGWEGGHTTYVYKGGIWSTMKQIVREEGIKGLYRGMIPNYFKVVPAVSISFVTYEHMKKVLDL